MSAPEALTKEVEASTERVVNDFSMTVATKNGSGSQTSNLTLLRALFKMGIPVSGKNLFPSNIQGLPTWYTIRVNKDGYTARSEDHQIVVAMNFDTFQDDLKDVVPGGAFFYADDIKLNVDREDIALYPIPARDIAKNSSAPNNLRDYVKNMAYVGALAQLLGIDMQKIEMALDFHFQGKQKPIQINMEVIEAARGWAEENLVKSDPYYLEPMDATSGFIMADGNTASAIGSIYGGVQFISWYPITPASSLAEEATKWLPELRCEVMGSCNSYAVVQAEDELAAIGMAVGAGWAGLRSMTSTSGPGISLMTEFAGLAYFAEVPVVIWDVMRVGPSTGLPTRTSQGDVTMIHFLGHGDTKNVMLLPGSANECFEFGWKSFDIAERLQTPVFVLSDLDLGMNQWMSQPFDYPDQPMDRGKILWEEDLEEMTERWGRYLDVDGDGIPYRTVLGNRHPNAGYFARGTGHDEYTNYTEAPDDWERNMARLALKWETARQYVPRPTIETQKDARVGIISYGSTDPAIKEARDYLAQDRIAVDYLRIRAIPFVDEVHQFIEGHEIIYVVEMNRDGQMHQLLTLEYPKLAVKLVSLTKHDGLPLSATWVRDVVLAEERE